MINRQRVKQHFSKSAESYDEAAVIQRQTAKDIAERIDLLAVPINAVLELGCGTGLLTTELLRRNPKLNLTAVDLAEGMLHYTKLSLKPVKLSWRFWDKPSSFVDLVQADAYKLPFADGSFDLIVSNFMLQWCSDLDAVFTEMRRVLNPGGALLFSTFGPDTLKELRQAWLTVEGDKAHTRFNDFIDMHDIGDALIRCGFGQPVMDADQIRLLYKNPIDVMHDLKALGATNAKKKPTDLKSGLMGRDRLTAVIKAYDQQPKDQGLAVATFEVVQGHAWAVAEIMKGPGRDKSGVVNITLDEFSKELKADR